MARLLFLLLFLLAGSIAQARQFRVPQVYPSLAWAAQAAGVGDTIRLASGVHDMIESVYLRQGVLICGAGRDSTRLTISEGSLLANQTRVEDLEIWGLAYESVFRIDNSWIEARRCRLTHGTILSFSGWNTQSALLVDCDLHDLVAVTAFNQWNTLSSVVLVNCTLSNITALDERWHPSLLMEGCVLDHVGSFGTQGWISYDQGEMRFHNCTFLSCGGVGTSLDYLEFQRCLWYRPGPNLLGTGNLRPDLIDIRETLMWTPGASSWTGLLADYLGVNGNLEADPLFCGSLSDPTLSINTPCLLDAQGTVMGARPIACGELELGVEGGQVGTDWPRLLRYSILRTATLDWIRWDVDGDGQAEGEGREFEWYAPQPGDYPVVVQASLLGFETQATVDAHAGGRLWNVVDGPDLVVRSAEAAEEDWFLLPPGDLQVQELSFPAGVHLVGDPLGTRLVGDGSGPLLTLTLGDAPTVVQELEFRAGRGQVGGALHLVPAGGAERPACRIQHCEFLDNRASQAGGAVGCGLPDAQLDVVVQDCLFHGNQAPFGGALFGPGVKLQRTRLEGNTASEAGGAWAAESRPTTCLEADSCQFTANVAARGGAIWGDARLMDCEFIGNLAEVAGGALWSPSFSAGVQVELDSCEFSGNSAPLGGALGGFGLALTACRFLDNHADSLGGAVWLGDSTHVADCLFERNRAANGGALAMDGPSHVLGCQFVANRADEQGGAIWNQPGFELRPLVLEGSLFQGNRSGQDGAAVFDGNGPRIRSCTFVGDSCGPVGAVLRLDARGSGPTPRLECSLVTDATGGRALWLAESGQLASCDLWHNACGDWTPPLAAWLGRDGNLWADPLYCDPAAGEFHLRPESPCRDAWDGCAVMGALPLGCEGTRLEPAPARPAGLGLTAWPNPFNPMCVLEFELEQGGPVELSCWNLAGQRMLLQRWPFLPAGTRQVRLDAGAWASGVYLARLQTERRMETIRLLLLK